MHFRQPSRILICAASKAGKTVLTQKIVANRDWLFTNGPPFKKVVWVCKRIEYAPKNLDAMVEVVEEIPTELERNSLIILDDQMTSLTKEILDLFIIKSHHLFTSVIFIAQNLFHNSKLFREISLQTEYLIVLKNPRDVNQFARFCQQLVGPGQTKALVNVYKKATAERYGYLLIDLSTACEDVFRYRNQIFQKEYFNCFILNNGDLREKCQLETNPFTSEQNISVRFS